MKSGNGNGRYISEGFLAFVVTFTALGLRLLHVVFTAKGNPLAADLVLDAAGYDRWAKALVWGGPPVATRIMQAPLYPWFLSVIYHLAGPSPTAVRCVQALMGAASVAMTVVITRRLLKSSAAGIIAGAAAALYLPLIFYEGVIVAATLIVFLNLLAVTLLAPEHGNPGLVRIIAAGIALALSVMAKPVALLLVPFAVLHLYFISVNERERGTSGDPDGSNGTPNAKAKNGARRDFFQRAGILIAAVIVALVPLTVRNHRITGEFIPLTTGGGINFFIGNNPRAIGFYTVPFYRGQPIGGTPEEQLERMNAFAAEDAGRELSAGAVSRFWLHRGIDFIRTHPREWGRLTWRKFLFFWNKYERANVENMRFHRRFGGIIGLPLLTFGVIAPFGLLGIFITRNRWRRLWLLYGGTIVYLAAALIFYVLARYRLPVVAFLAPFAGAAVTELLKYARDERWGEIIIHALILVILIFFCNMRVAGDTPGGTAGNLGRLGTVYLSRGDTTLAIESFREAVRTDPSNAALQQGLERLERRYRRER